MLIKRVAGNILPSACVCGFAWKESFSLPRKMTRGRKLRGVPKYW